MLCGKKPSNIVFVISVTLLLTWMTAEVPYPSTKAYTPSIGDYTVYDYGFICVQSNQSKAIIESWTGLGVAEDNYTMRWQQFVNLSIVILNIAPIGGILRAFYNFSVIIHSNIVTVANSSWQKIMPLNGSVTSPAPTGVSSGLFDSPITEGLPGFFLDDFTLANVLLGSNAVIGESLWDSITYTTFTIEGTEQLCYQLVNSSSLIGERIEITLVIDQDVGIYYRVNETRTLKVDSSEQSLNFYYEVLSTTISPIPLPNPWLTLGIPIIAIIIIIITMILFGRFLCRRRYQI